MWKGGTLDVPPYLCHSAIFGVSSRLVPRPVNPGPAPRGACTGRPRPGRGSHPGPCRVVPDLASSAFSHSLGSLIPPAAPCSLGLLVPPCCVATLSILRALPRVGPLSPVGALPGLVHASPVLALRPRLLGRTIRRGLRAFLRVNRCGNHQRYGEAQAK